MAARAEYIDMDEMPGTEIALVTPERCKAILSASQEFSAFYERLKEETASARTADVNTEKGRKLIRSNAARIGREAATIDRERLGLTKGLRDQVEAINAQGKVIKDQLDTLKHEIRAPLTEWEEKDKQRVAECEAVLNRLATVVRIDLGDTAATVSARLAEVDAIEIDDAKFQDLAPHARDRRDHAIEALKLGRDRLVLEEERRAQAERDAAELAELRAEQARRQQEEAARAAEAKAKEEEFQRRRADADALIRHCRDCGNGIIGGQSQSFGLLLYELENKIVIPDRLADFRADIELARDTALERIREVMARAAEERKREEEKAEAERAAQVKADAERKAKEEADAKAKAEIDAANERARKVEEAAKAERQRVADEKAAEEARRAQIEADRLARERDQAHRAKVQDEAIAAIAKAGAIGEPKARAIVLAIAAGNVPAIRIQF